MFHRFLFAQAITSSSETLAYPLDTIRRRLMMESGKAADQRTYKGTVDCGSKILSKEGVSGFFKGNLSNFWRSIGSSIVLVLYDELQKYVHEKGY
jgi:solute carrier family 25 (adenine nucleotide translocator) protein 4/5/6/31